MHKDITAIIVVTILSALSIPSMATIYGIKYLNEVLSFPHDLESLGLFANVNGKYFSKKCRKSVFPVCREKKTIIISPLC